MAFDSVARALAWALTTDTVAVIARPRLGRPGWVRAGRARAGTRCAPGLTPFERAAQATLLLRLLHAHCRRPVICAATALYRPADVPAGAGRGLGKDRAIDSLTWHIASYPRLGGYPWAYLRDVVCFWANAPTANSERQWCAHLGKSARMLRYIKHGHRRRRRLGVYPLLDDLLAEAEAVLAPVLAARGLLAPIARRAGPAAAAGNDRP